MTLCKEVQRIIKTNSIVRSIGEFKNEIIYSTANKVVTNSQIIELYNSSDVSFGVSMLENFKGYMFAANGSKIHIIDTSKAKTIQVLTVPNNSMITGIDTQDNNILVSSYPNQMYIINCSNIEKPVFTVDYAVSTMHELYGIQKTSQPGMVFLSGNIYEEKKKLSTLSFFYCLKDQCFQVPKTESLILLRENIVSFKSLCMQFDLFSCATSNMQVTATVDINIMRRLFYLICVCKYDNKVKQHFKFAICNHIIASKIAKHRMIPVKYAKWVSLRIINDESYTEKTALNLPKERFSIFNYRVCPICTMPLLKHYSYDSHLLGLHFDFPKEHWVECGNGHRVYIVDLSFKLWPCTNDDYRQCTICSAIIKSTKPCKLCGS